MTAPPVERPGPPGTAAERQQLFVVLTREKRRLAATLDTINAQLGELEQAILAYFADTGTTKVTIDGMTLSSSQRWSAATGNAGRQGVVAALEEAGLQDMLTANWATLAAYVAELGRAGQPVPFDERIRITEYYKLSARET